MSSAPRFKIFRKLDAGGMAEVYHAEQESLEGFQKTVAVKRVLPHLAQDEKFLRMFLDEARLSLRMNHANVVQVFQVGQAGGSYYVIMEFVDGVNLKQINEYMAARRRTMPVEQAVFIIAEACKGLHYAHTMTDSSGKPLGIVHRDVSPANILISKQGEVKLVDFGLAKAADQLEHTDPGVVKGKFGYLSPEAVEAHDVDRRADIFAAGILLWEMLTGRRLFQGKTDYETVQKVKEARVPPPSQINPAVPRDLERIVLKALARDLRQRYQTAQEFGDDLYQMLFSHGLMVTNHHIAKLVETVLQAAAPRPKAAVSIIDELIESELARLSSIDDTDDILRGGERPLSLEEISGMLPAVTRLEDTRTWAADLDDGVAIPVPPAGKPAVWHEAMPTPMPFRAIRKAAPGLGDSQLAEHPPAAMPEPGTPKRRSYSGVLVGIVVLLAAVCAVLVYVTFFR